jgi:hypothetical protein
MLDREEDTHNWTKKEAMLKKQIDKSKEAIREVTETSKALLKGQADMQSRTATTQKSQQHSRKVSEPTPRTNNDQFLTQAHKDIRTSIANQVKREVDRLNRIESQPRTVGRSASGYNLRPTEESSTNMSFGEREDLSTIRRHLVDGEDEDLEDLTGKSRVSAKLTRIPSEHLLPKKPSLRSMKVTGQKDKSASAGSDSNEHMQEANTTAHSRMSRRATSQLRNKPDMTSAFIIPDITLGIAEPTQHPSLSSSAKQILAELSPHESANCTVCRRITCTEHVSSNPILAPRPIPVTDRMPETSEWTEEYTSRPVQSPSEALATVLKGLEDELAHAKAELLALQSAYNKFDASSGKRHRKSMLKKIDRLLKAIDAKSDQIYALYDVVESQKLAGIQMDAGALEMTLESIGIGFEQKETQVIGTGEDDSESDEEELPWEGIEDNTGRTHESRHHGWHY